MLARSDVVRSMSSQKIIPAELCCSIGIHCAKWTYDFGHNTFKHSRWNSRMNNIIALYSSETGFACATVGTFRVPCRNQIISVYVHILRWGSCSTYLSFHGLGGGIVPTDMLPAICCFEKHVVISLACGDGYRDIITPYPTHMNAGIYQWLHNYSTKQIACQD